MSRYPASTVAPFTLLVPVVGIVTAWSVRNERPTWGELAGSFVVLVGLGLALGVVDALASARTRRSAASCTRSRPLPITSEDRSDRSATTPSIRSFGSVGR
jgi:O-acetylserine/cysteine efflux transporter